MSQTTRRRLRLMFHVEHWALSNASGLSLRHLVVANYVLTRFPPAPWPAQASNTACCTEEAQLWPHSLCAGGFVLGCTPE
jgi:hypothetical protein